MPNAIVFGASSGIGRQLSIFLANDGYRVGITARRIEKLHELEATNKEAFRSYQLDVQKLEATQAVFKAAVHDLGALDLVVHCSGIGYENPDLHWEKELDTVRTNVIATTLIYDLTFNLFKAQGYGHLVSISSIAALRGNRHSPAYFASKAFQVNYLESLYFKTKEIKGSKIHITDIRPGYIDTRMAIGDDKFWMSSLEKASKQIYKAIKRKKRRVYITKRWILMSWVLKIVPSWLQRKVM